KEIDEKKKKKTQKKKKPRAPLTHAQSDFQDLHHGQIYPAKNDAVNRQPKIQRTKPSEKRSGFSGIAQLGKLDVRHHSSAAPEPRIEKHRQHSTHDEVPPEPVTSDSILRHETRYRY